MPRRNFYRDHYSFVRTFYRDDAKVTQVEGAPVHEIRRTAKALLLSGNGRSSWFPMRALEAIDIDRGIWRIAGWFHGFIDADKQQLLTISAPMDQIGA